jgi:hypothetical protein
MISMKVQEGTLQQPGIWSPRKEINMIKEALKRDYLYSGEELRKLKGRLRDMYIVNQQLKRTNGFGK